MANSENDMDVDSQTAAKIQKLVSDEATAAKRKDYEEALHIKDAMERLKTVGREIPGLQARWGSASPSVSWQKAYVPFWQSCSTWERAPQELIR